ncbi:hypothetical protein F5B22DRAFT_650188 [Xylaria bambusicola]|uniref:uncharacterized protein n=1 Tax=Xylaria bambusicola TaxID=326684 RepID=UPI0020078B95|nr:uncharacterized protein F5B22DRAFT_650188 [Xylaria bambusicola]KAI0508332.1 hypothetical protein F5B22DRAFT_650188 [Xylaria bambusicola]
MASEKITAIDMIAIPKDKLATQAGFKDGATAKVHYEPLLNRNHGHDYGGDAPPKRQSLHDNKPKTVATEDGNKRYARNPYDLDDGEVEWSAQYSRLG